MPSDAEITFADHAGRLFARRYGMAPMVGRLLGYLAICDPREQTIAQLAEALLASRSAIAGAITTLDNLDMIRRSRAAGERMDRVCIDLTGPRSMGFDVAEYREQADLAREGLALVADEPVERQAVLLEWAAFADFLVERLPQLGEDWKAHRDRLRAAGELPDTTRHTRRLPMTIDLPAISARSVRKSYGEHVVLDGVDLAVPDGTIFALLGPNGAGKTTMVRILSTLIRADAGEVRVGGHDVMTDADAVRALIGVTGQFSAVDNLLTGRENLQLMADLRHLGRAAGRRRVAELLDRFELTEAAGKPLSTYSGGMRRRLDLAMTLVGDPKVIFLDEPTTGLDPRSRRTMWQIIRELVSGGVTILLTTQYLEEADQLADRVAVLDDGRIVAEGTPAELKSRIPGGHIELHFTEPAALQSAAGMLPNAAPDPDQLTLQVPNAGGIDSIRRVLNDLDTARIDVADFSIYTPDLDDVFFAVTGHAGCEPTSHPEEALQR